MASSVIFQSLSTRTIVVGLFALPNEVLMITEFLRLCRLGWHPSMVVLTLICHNEHWWIIYTPFNMFPGWAASHTAAFVITSAIYQANNESVFCWYHSNNRLIDDSIEVYHLSIIAYWWKQKILPLTTSKCCFGLHAIYTSNLLPSKILPLIFLCMCGVNIQKSITTSRIMVL
jgi:hypothetical protein